MPIRGGCFLFTGKNCPSQCVHNDFSHEKGTGLCFFVIATGADEAGFWLADGSGKYVHYDTTSKRVLADLLEMSLIYIPVHSVFVGNGYLQHAGAVWSGTLLSGTICT